MPAELKETTSKAIDEYYEISEPYPERRHYILSSENNFKVKDRWNLAIFIPLCDKF
jgi:hypothetical protein